MENHKQLTIIALSILFLLLLASIFFRPEFIKDSIFVLLLTVLFYFVEKKMSLPDWGFILVLVVIILHPVGLLLNFYALFVAGIGYDKFFHFTTGLTMTLVFYAWLRKKLSPTFAIIVAVLMTLGVGSINEIVEFIGQQYLNIQGPTMFSQGDLLPATLTNDLVKYDTWYDMIFNLIGSMVATVISAFIMHKHEKPRS